VLASGRMVILVNIVIGCIPTQGALWHLVQRFQSPEFGDLFSPALEVLEHLHHERHGIQFSLDVSDPEYGVKAERSLPPLFADALSKFRKLFAPIMRKTAYSQDGPLPFAASARCRATCPTTRSRQRASTVRLSPAVYPAAARGRTLRHQPRLPARLNRASSIQIFVLPSPNIRAALSCQHQGLGDTSPRPC
jgi:hypothetical protein